MKNNQYYNLKEAIETSRMSDSIMIWGASPKSDEIASIITELGYDIYGYVDKNPEIKEYRGYMVYPIERLKEKKYFVYVALWGHYKEVLDLLEQSGYQEYVNFWYPKKRVELDGTKNYEDQYGNRLVTKNITPIRVLLRDGGEISLEEGNFNQTVKIDSLGESKVVIGKNVKLSEKAVVSSVNGTIIIGNDCTLGFDSKILSNGKKLVLEEGSVNQTIKTDYFTGGGVKTKIIIGEKVKISEKSMISSENGTIVIKNNCTLGSDSKILCKITPEAVRESKVVIGENVHFLEKMAILSENGTIIIGNNCTLFSHFKINATCGGVVHIGDRCTFQDYCWMSVCFGAKLRFGQDCMVSYFVLTRAGNGHNIIDLNTGVNLDDNSKRDIHLGEHVWVGMRVMLLSGAVIGSGSIIGANSFVNKEFPCNCCLAGNPARVIKERTAWIRERMKLNKNMEDYENYIFG